jgi:CRISPR system Cascade subunit CasB
MNVYQDLIQFLRPLAQKEGEYNPKKRAVLAELRRGLTDFPRLSPYLHPHLQPILPDDVKWWQKQTYYLIAALFALHPKFPEREDRYTNLGDHFAAAREDESDKNTALERRFSLLLTAHPEDLYYHLRQAISYLKSKDENILINWPQLIRDVDNWYYDDSRAKVQEKWAAQFCRKAKPAPVDGESPNEFDG